MQPVGIVQLDDWRDAIYQPPGAHQAVQADRRPTPIPTINNVCGLYAQRSMPASGLRPSECRDDLFARASSARGCGTA